MGQKVLPLSVREKARYAIVSSQLAQTHIIRNLLINFFNKKGLLINEIDIKQISSSILINIEFLFSRNSVVYTRNFRRFFRTKKMLKQQNKGYSIKNLFKLLIVLFNVNKILLKIKRLEFNLNKHIYIKMKQDGSKFGLMRQIKHKSIQDLLLINTLLLSNINIKADLIARVISKHFSWLPKKNHKIYLVFLRNFFKSVYTLNKHYLNIIYGIKFEVNGRISGKDQASSFKSTIGSINAQTVSINVDYACCASYSKLGVFGWKIWISKNL